MKKQRQAQKELLLDSMSELATALETLNYI